MTKIAFMFPGQGSYEAGMGREVAEAVPEAMRIYEQGSEASGLDLQEICFRGPAAASSCAIARPIPFEAPVTSAVLPSRLAKSGKRLLQLAQPLQVADRDRAYVAVDPLQ